MTDESREEIHWQGRVPTVDEVAEGLRWSTWHAMNRHPKVCGVVPEERLDAREHIQWVPDGGIAHRPIWFGHWQLDGEDQS